MGRSCLKWYSSQMTFNNKNSIPFASALLPYFCHGTKDLASAAFTLQNYAAWKKRNGDHIAKRQMPFSISLGVVFLNVCRTGRTNTYMLRASLLDSIYYRHLIFFACYLFYLCNTIQEDAGGTRSTLHPFRNWTCCWAMNAARWEVTKCETGNCKA